MAAFPAIEPSSRSYSIAGDFPMQEERAWPAGFIRYRTGLTPLTAVGLPLDLGFEDVTESQLATIRAHYRNQQGGTIPFTLPAVIWQGHATAIVPTSTQWRYTSPPKEDGPQGGIYAVTVSLESVDYTSDEPA
jgi:hypothetical protein